MIVDPRVPQQPKTKKESEKADKPPLLHVAMVAPEIGPFAKTGGLGDVLDSLPKALEQLGVRLSLIMPAYRSVLQGEFGLENAGTFSVPVSDRRERVRLLRTTTGKAITVYFIRADWYFDREYYYGSPEGGYPDNAERFVYFSRAVLEVLKLDPPHVFHAHDWQSALSIAFLRAQPNLYRELSSVKTVMTVHNLGYQGVFWGLDWHLLNLDRSFFTPRYLEFYGDINFLKGGLVFADAIGTVSPTYAEEIKTPEYGFRLDGVFRERAANLVGILNGADYNVWNPETDLLISKRYSPKDLFGKRVCKTDLQRLFCLPVDPNVPLIGMVTRLTSQKGLDLMDEALEELLSRRLQLVILGTGDKYFQDIFSEEPAMHPGKLAVKIDFDEALAHKVIAGSDMLLMPSRYEPCGLTQLYGLKYGTIPVVRATGGLKDTIEEFDPEKGSGKGFVFASAHVPDLLEAVDNALDVFQQKEKWAALMKNAIAADYSWNRSAQKYLELYRKLVKTHDGV